MLYNFVIAGAQTLCKLKLKSFGTNGEMYLAAVFESLPVIIKQMKEGIKPGRSKRRVAGMLYETYIGTLEAN